jgi:alanyl-tRNA synthetase
VLAEGWQELDSDAVQQFVGYDSIDVSTDVIALRREDGRGALVLRQNPFYIEAGGQVSDSGWVEGDGWRMKVEEVRRVSGRVALVGQVEGSLPEATAPIRVRAVVERRTRHDTVRNHTATHLLHAALRTVLGTHVVQRGSLVAPDRLRFDFAHPRPLTQEELRRVEDEVNAGILEDYDVVIQQMAQAEAIGRGAMALFGEKYGDVVRVVSIPGVSMELCGGTHARHTGEIGLFRIVSETGVAAGVRRIEAVTGTEAYRKAIETDAMLERAAALVRTTPDSLVRRLEQVAEENRELKRRLERARQSGGGDRVTELLASATSVDGMRVIASSVDAEGPDDLRALGDRLRERLGSGAAVLAAAQEGRVSLLCVVTDDLPGRGVRANDLIRQIAAAAGGSGGGKAHMAQGGAGDAAKVEEALRQTVDIVRTLLSAKS